MAFSIFTMPLDFFQKLHASFKMMTYLSGFDKHIAAFDLQIEFPKSSISQFKEEFKLS